jgi:hypothetical protein
LYPVSKSNHASTFTKLTVTCQISWLCMLLIVTTWYSICPNAQTVGAKYRKE